MYSFIHRVDNNNSNLVCTGKDYEEVFREGLRNMCPYGHYVIKDGREKNSTVLWECSISEKHLENLRK